LLCGNILTSLLPSISIHIDDKGIKGEVGLSLVVFQSITKDLNWNDGFEGFVKVVKKRRRCNNAAVMS
jgi:hypothetical protein